MSGKRKQEEMVMKDYISLVLSSMRTDMSRVESTVSNFEKKIDAIMSKIDNLEERVAYLERILGVEKRESSK